MRISQEKKTKISEQILSFLFESNPRSLFISQISKEIARDEEFVKRLLMDLAKKGLVDQIKKNPQGISYKKRARWKLSNKSYEAYKNIQAK